MTVRLPYDEYREVAVRAKQRGWSMSDYIGYCVARVVVGNRPKRAKEQPLTNHAFRSEDEFGKNRKIASIAEARLSERDG